MKPFLPLLALACLGQPVQAQAAGLSPAQIGTIFCIGSLADDMAPVLALLTPDFARAITTATDQNQAAIAAAPGDKPPLGDGLPWRNWPDYADQCTVGEATDTGGEAYVVITYDFTAAPEAGYSNTLLLRPVPSEPTPLWRVDDVIFDTQSTMRQTLRDAFPE